jgi:hypothetical protein
MHPLKWRPPNANANSKCNLQNAERIKINAMQCKNREFALYL